MGNKTNTNMHHTHDIFQKIIKVVACRLNIARDYIKLGRGSYWTV